MTQSGRDEGVRGNREVPPKRRDDVQHRRQREGGPRGKRGFLREPEPTAEVA
jgi:hypothetical protein